MQTNSISPQPETKRRIFVTGGASGLGKAVALKFASEGFRVCIGDVNDERGHEVESTLKAMDQNAFYMRCDVRRAEDLQTIRKRLEEAWDGVDVVVNNAGVGGAAGPIEDVALSHWHSVVDINLMGVVRGCKIFTPLFKEQGSGHFVNIASGAGYINAPFLSSYSVTKAGVISLSETLWAELGDQNIGVSVVCPGFFHTNLTESMHSEFEGLETKVNKMMEENKITAGHVADSVFHAYQKNQFLVLPHTTERLMWYFKRLSPRGFAALMKRYGKQLFA